MPLEWNLIPDNTAITAILAASIEGPYRFVHHALIPYVRVGPAQASATITVHGGPLVTLLDAQASLQLRGIEQTRDFAVMLHGIDGVSLREVAWRATALDAIDPVPRLPEVATTRLPRAKPPRRIGTVPAASHMPIINGRYARLAVAPKPSVPSPMPPVVPAPQAPGPMRTVDLTIPDAWRAFCETHDVHPEQGDYVVLPVDQVDAYPPRPAWVATTPSVSVVHLIKPRSGEDRVL